MKPEPLPSAVWDRLLAQRREFAPVDAALCTAFEELDTLRALLVISYREYQLADRTWDEWKASYDAALAVAATAAGLPAKALHAALVAAGRDQEL